MKYIFFDYTDDDLHLDIPALKDPESQLQVNYSTQEAMKVQQTPPCEEFGDYGFFCLLDEDENNYKPPEKCNKLVNLPYRSRYEKPSSFIQKKFLLETIEENQPMDSSEYPDEEKIVKRPRPNVDKPKDIIFLGTLLAITLYMLFSV
jgi:hypothetical protein